MSEFIQKQLMCRFSDSKNYTKDIDYISKTCELIDDRIFVLSNANNSREIFLTFNIKKNRLNKVKYLNTISIHRKNHTNTLYTLNAMNRLIEDENGGVFDKTFQLDWDLYKNSIILINDPGVKIISLKLFSIINF
jgi:hypothetical protein